VSDLALQLTTGRITDPTIRHTITALTGIGGITTDIITGTIGAVGKPSLG
jgi:hypothetical protein